MECDELYKHVTNDVLAEMRQYFEANTNWSVEVINAKIDKLREVWAAKLSERQARGRGAANWPGVMARADSGRGRNARQVPQRDVSNGAPYALPYTQYGQSPGIPDSAPRMVDPYAFPGVGSRPGLGPQLGQPSPYLGGNMHALQQQQSHIQQPHQLPAQQQQPQHQLQGAPGTADGFGAGGGIPQMDGACDDESNSPSNAFSSVSNSSNAFSSVSNADQGPREGMGDPRHDPRLLLKMLGVHVPPGPLVISQMDGADDEPPAKRAKGVDAANSTPGGPDAAPAAAAAGDEEEDFGDDLDDDDDDENDNPAPAGKEEEEEEEEEEVQDGEGEDETLGEGDDDVDDEEPQTNNLVMCQFEKCRRERSRWTFYLKDGIMHLKGRDYCFKKATGTFQWDYQ